MMSSDIIRWGGIAAMLGGVLWVVWSLLIRVSFQAAGGPFSDGLLLLAALFTLAGRSSRVESHAAVGARHTHYGRCRRWRYKDLAQSVDSRPSVSFWGRNMGLYAGPLGIG